MIFIYCSPITQAIIIKDFLKYNLELKQVEYSVNEAINILSLDFDIQYKSDGNIKLD